MLKREIRRTKDGSRTLFIPEWNESYHSKHGALQEAEHVFIRNGIELLSERSDIHILEYGFGTGLNALLSLMYAEKNKQKISYTSLEKYPLEIIEADAMEFPVQIASTKGQCAKNEIDGFYSALHAATWNTFIRVTENFSIQKIKTDFRDFEPEKNFYDLIYFDAFGIRVQPELWDKQIFCRIFESMKKDSLFTTYACNSSTIHSLKACGFETEKKQGPPGKREMLNAWKK